MQGLTGAEVAIPQEAAEESIEMHTVQCTEMAMGTQQHKEEGTRQRIFEDLLLSMPCAPRTRKSFVEKEVIWSLVALTRSPAVALQELCKLVHDELPQTWALVLLVGRLYVALASDGTAAVRFDVRSAKLKRSTFSCQSFENDFVREVAVTGQDWH